MSSTTETLIKSAKRIHLCSWCGEKINVGDSYWRWRYYGGDDPATCKLHPECEDARHASEWTGEPWPFYEQARGIPELAA